LTVDHRQLGVDLFNEVWRLIETREDDDRMVHAAHASRYHWGEAPECEPENLARGEWQVSRVYTVVGLPRQRCAMRGAASTSARSTASATGISPTRTRRSRARTGPRAPRPEAEAYKKLASEVPVAEDDDREHLDEDLATI
jgi:hypothetical protein